MENPEPTYQTLIFIKMNNQEVWLGRKKRGFGQGLLNGYGGKIMAGESATDCILRELEEESCLKLNKNDIKYLGYNDYFDCSIQERRIVYMYTATGIDKEPQETEEVENPQKYSYECIPYSMLWPDAIYWMHLVLKECFFKGTFVLERSNVKSVHIQVLTEAPKENSL